MWLLIKQLSKSIIWTVLISLYSLIIIFHCFHRGGILSQFIKNYKQKKIITKKYNLRIKQYDYYRNLLLKYRGGDRNALAIIIFLKFHKIMNNYKVIDLNSKKK